MWCSLFILNIAALQEQRNALDAGIDSTVGESSPMDQLPFKDKLHENSEPLAMTIRQVPIEGESRQGLIPTFIRNEFHIENGIETGPNVELQLIPSSTGRSTADKSRQDDNPELKNLSALRNGSDEDIFVSLQLGESKPKRRKSSNSSFSNEEPKTK